MTFIDIEVFAVKKILVLIVIFFIVAVSSFVTVYAPQTISEYQKKDFRSGKNKLTLLYNQLFSENEYAYNHKLAQKSLDVAISAFSSDESMKFWGETALCGRENNIKNKLTKIGFEQIDFYNYDISLNDDSAKVAFSIAKTEYDSNTILIAIVIRGGKYGLEWADNFNIGDNSTPYHAGFYEAAAKVKAQADITLADIPSDKTVKIWITGYSRGGAVSNILASMYDDAKTEYPCHIYAYTFASPKTTIINTTRCHDTIYKNIFNILSPNDPVYNIPPNKWGYGRFGICVVFPDNNIGENESNSKTYEAVYGDYRARTGKTLVTQEKSVNTIVNLIIKSADSKEFFYNNLMNPIKKLITIKMAKYKAESGSWENYDSDTAIREFYGEEILEEKEKLKTGYLFNSLKKLGVKLPEDLYIFISLCVDNGFDGYENLIFTRLNIDELVGLSEITSGDFLYIGHTPDFYLSWINNVPVAELRFIKD